MTDLFEAHFGTGRLVGDAMVYELADGFAGLTYIGRETAEVLKAMGECVGRFNLLCPRSDAKLTSKGWRRHVRRMKALRRP